MNAYLVLGSVVGLVLLLQSTEYAIENYDLITLGAGASMYYLFTSMKLVFLKKPFEWKDVLLTALIMFIVGFGQKVVAAMVYPEADANKDGLVTRKEFEAWKNKM